MTKKIGKFDEVMKFLPGETVDGRPTYAPVAINLEFTHHEVHEGSMFEAWVYTGTVANAGTIDLAISLTGSSKGAHLVWAVASGGDAVAFLYEGMTGTLSTEATKVNLNRMSANTSPVMCFQYPGVTVLGILLNTAFLPGGSGNAAAGTNGGVVRSNSEWILSPGKRYLIRGQNLAGTAQPMGITVQWYDHD